MAKKVVVNVGATSIDRKNAADEAAKFIDDVTKGLRQDEKLSKSKYRALKTMAKELLDTKNIDQDTYDIIIQKLDEMRK